MLIFSGVYLLGYLPTHNRIYVADKDLSISSYALSLNVVEYQTAILRGDMEAAESLLPSIPTDQRNRIARFLEAQGELARISLGNEADMQISRSSLYPSLRTQTTDSISPSRSTTWKLPFSSFDHLTKLAHKPSGRSLATRHSRRGK